MVLEIMRGGNRDKRRAFVAESGRFESGGGGFIAVEGGTTNLGRVIFCCSGQPGDRGCYGV